MLPGLRQLALRSECSSWRRSSDKSSSCHTAEKAVIMTGNRQNGQESLRSVFSYVILLAASWQFYW